MIRSTQTEPRQPTATAKMSDPVAQFRAQKRIWTPANFISFSRVLLVIPAVYLLSEQAYTLAAITFVVAFATDLLDGFVARKTGDISEYGKIIDPLADKLFVGSIVLAMLFLGLAPLWFVVAIITRDLLIFSAGIWAGRKFKTVLPSNYPGKGAVLVISLTLFLTVLGVSQPELVFMQGLSLVLMLVSLGVYTARLLRLIRATG